jgi:spermidine synthase
MVTPFAVRLCLRDPEYAGRTSGGLYAVSTIGSIAGTFIAGFVLIAWLGNTAIILATAVLLAIAALLLDPSHRLLKTVSLVVFLLLLLFSRYQDLKMAGLGFIDQDTPYNRVLVYVDKDFQTGRLIREMVTGPGGRQSAMFLDDATDLVVAYTRFYRLVEYYQPAMSNMLVLGGGGYSFPKYALKHYPNVKVDVVELDPGITELARKHFALADDSRLKVIEEDARTFLWSLQKSSTRYDVILCDVFTSHYSIPFHMVTREAATLMKEALSPQGVILVNVLASLEGHSSRFYKALYATYSEVFDHIDLYAVQDPGDSHRRQNIILVAGNSLVQQQVASDEIQRMLAHAIPKPQGGFSPFTDEFAPVDRYLTEM